MKMPSWLYNKSHGWHNMILQSSYLRNMISCTGKTSLIWTSFLSEPHSVMWIFTSVWVTWYAIETGKRSQEIRSYQNMAISDHVIASKHACRLSVYTSEQLQGPLRLLVSGFLSPLGGYTVNLWPIIHWIPFLAVPNPTSRSAKFTPSSTILSGDAWTNSWAYADIDASLFRL